MTDPQQIIFLRLEEQHVHLLTSGPAVICKRIKTQPLLIFFRGFIELKNKQTNK